ncbi:MAG: hypothetical protein U1F81_19830 [Verrucomicrobiaceae bacterium]
MHRRFMRSRCPFARRKRLVRRFHRIEQKVLTGLLLHLSENFLSIAKFSKWKPSEHILSTFFRMPHRGNYILEFGGVFGATAPTSGHSTSRSQPNMARLDWTQARQRFAA